MEYVYRGVAETVASFTARPYSYKQLSVVMLPTA